MLVGIRVCGQPCDSPIPVAMPSFAIRPIAIDHPQLTELMRRSDEYQAALYPAESIHSDSLDTLEKQAAVIVGAFEAARLLGCAAVKPRDGYGEIKRMFVLPEARGRGIAKGLLTALERALVDHGIYHAKLETGVRQPAALQLYETYGYRRCEPFAEYWADPLSVFMEKDLST